jgi:ribose transport system substrate-binding protein
MLPNSGTQKRRGVWPALRLSPYALFCAVAAATVLVGAVACGSSPSSSNGGSGRTQQANAGASNADASQRLQEALSATAKVEKRPTSVGVTVPVGKPIPEGKKIAFVVPAVASAQLLINPLKAAAAALDWTTTVINAGTSPQSYVAAVQQADQLNPSGVFISGVPPDVIQRQLAELKSKHIPVIYQAAPLDSVPNASTGIIFNVAGNQYSDQSGIALADWVTADSKGHASALVIGISDIPGPLVISAAFKEQFEKVCPGCTFASENFPAATMGQSLPTTIAGYLRTHKDVNYVIADFDDEFAGVPAALKAAGITGVKLAGGTATALDQVNIAAGNYEAAAIGFPLFENPWRVIDVFARYFAGTSIAVSANAPLPLLLLTKGNQSEWGGAPSDNWPLVANYAEQYKKLWGVG